MRELRWNCKDKGCFRRLCPKLGFFDGCFPGRIGMSDVDGIVEISGRFLLLEWKSEGGALHTGQRIMFERLTGLSPKITAIVVSGDPESMAVKSVVVFSNGRASQSEELDAEGLRDRITQWANRAQQARIRPSRREEA